MLMPRPASLGLCKLIRRWPALILRKVQLVRWCQWWMRQSRCCESGSLIVNISGCGGSAQNRHLESAPKEPRVCWCVSPATVRWSTMAPITPSAKGMCCSCPPWSERVCADRVVPSACWKFHCRKATNP